MKQRLFWSALALALATVAHGATLDTGTAFPTELKPVQEEAEAAHLAASAHPVAIPSPALRGQPERRGTPCSLMGFACRSIQKPIAA